VEATDKGTINVPCKWKTTRNVNAKIKDFFVCTPEKINLFSSIDTKIAKTGVFSFISLVKISEKKENSKQPKTYS
jgi:hypothetical protein